MFDFLNIFSNPLILLAVTCPVVLLVGVLMGNYVSQPSKNRVLKISPESGRGIELDVKSEDATNVYCSPVGNIPPQKFVKRVNAFTIVKKGWLRLQNYALWFGRYGTAYVQEIKNASVKITLQEAIMNIFGESLYKQIPQAQKTQIEKGDVGVLVEFPKNKLTPKGLPSISEDDINRDNDTKAMANLWDAFNEERKRDAIQMFAFIGCGVAIGIVLALMFGWGAPTVINPVIPS